MEKNDLKSKTKEQLNNNLSMIKVVSLALIVVLGLLMSVTIYGFITKDNNSTFIALFAVAISCSAILPMQFMSLKKIKKELKLRMDTEIL